MGLWEDLGKAVFQGPVVQGIIPGGTGQGELGKQIAVGGLIGLVGLAGAAYVYHRVTALAQD